MRLKAAAKINLHLRVAPIGTDGFHPLLSWFVTLQLFDNLTIEPSSGAQVTLHCGDPKIPTDERNTVIRAARLLQLSAAQELSRGAVIHLEKRIPAGGGLAGGSSDAAATLRALNDLWKCGLSLPQLTDLAAQVGSDVPFFLTGGSCVCSGRGEIVRRIAPPTPKAALLILPGYESLTAMVYRKFDALDQGSIPNVSQEPDWLEWAGRSAESLLPVLVNDLEPAAFALNPQLRDLRDEMEQKLGRIVRMSGSGSTLFTLFDEASEAKAAQERLSQHPAKTVVAPIAAESPEA